MSYVCSSTSATPIPANPVRSPAPYAKECQPRTPGGVVRTTEESRPPVAVTTPIASSLLIPSARVMPNPTYLEVARPVNCAAYAMRSSATCSTVYRTDHSREPAGTSQSRSATDRSSAAHSATASST